MKRCLFWNWQALSFVLVAALSAAVLASPHPGYLPWGGPSPLRFCPAARPSTHRFILPLPVPAPEPAPAVSQAGKTPPPHPAVPASGPAPPATAPGADNGAAQLSAESAASDAVIPPQAFLKYFSKSTNSAATTNATQLDFTPPKVPEPPHSSASYSTGP